MPRPHRYWLISAWLAATNAAAAPLAVSTDELTAVCQQLDSVLTCELLPRTDMEIKAAELTHPGAPALPAQLLARPGGKRYSVLLLVDTSDPGRASVVAADRDNLRSALATFDPLANVGFARFDADLEVLLPPAPASARTPQEVEAAITSVR
ncbi:MAG: hypothetical protein HKO62_03120, partial [Gammaproteobacteria bacterium]|nr:hypothetical protein [Gammaproteobacteria bacterium]